MHGAMRWAVLALALAPVAAFGDDRPQVVLAQPGTGGNGGAIERYTLRFNQPMVPLGDPRAHSLDDILGHRERDLAHETRPHRAREIERDERHMIAIDVQPDRETAIGVDPQPHRRLAPRARPAPRVYDQLGIEQSRGDIGDCR